MAARPPMPIPPHRELSRLRIPLHPSMPVMLDGQPLFNPPPSQSQQFYPMVQNQVPPTPGFYNPSPTHQMPPHLTMHRMHPSIAQMAASGMPIPMNIPIPMTPGGQIAFSPQLNLLSPPVAGVPFQPSMRQRRQPSISIGGPPKAALGGPNRKLSPLPAEASPLPAPDASKPKKKFIVKLPVESGSDALPPSWARKPVPLSSLPPMEVIPPTDLTTAEVYPAPLTEFPNTMDVFLPGKTAWDAYKRSIMEEKLAKLGVERPSAPPGFLPQIPVPNAFVPSHLAARAASISSPADPALLHFKLNKLQQLQRISPQPQHPLLPESPSPLFSNPPHRLGHGHTMSLAANYNSNPYFPINPPGSFNPFGPRALLGSEHVVPPQPQLHLVSESDVEEEGELSGGPEGWIHAPQAKTFNNPSATLLGGTSTSSISPAPSADREQPNFTVGFGLDVPDESEEDEVYEEAGAEESSPPDNDGAMEEGDGVLSDNFTTPMHSRHVSKASLAMSVRELAAIARRAEETFAEEDARAEREEIHAIPAVESAWAREEVDRANGVSEWTGSEIGENAPALDNYPDTESTGEYSNPSDEERARAERYLRRKARAQEATPRRLPEFPLPPPVSYGGAPSTSDDMISNPSDEGEIEARRQDYVDPFYHAGTGIAESQSPGRFPRPLPPIPAQLHSRQTSSSMQMNSSTPPAIRTTVSVVHSRANSGVSPASTGNLNPLAKPFVFGAPRQSASFAPTAFNFAEPPTEPEVHRRMHSRQLSMGSKLNAAAAEFKPTGFTFRPPPGGPTFSLPPPSEHTVSLRHVSEDPVSTSPVRAVQGREKRQRRGTVTDDGEEAPSFEHDRSQESRDNIATFKFPRASPPRASNAMFDQEQELDHEKGRASSQAPEEKEDPAERVAKIKLNAAARPFTFSGFTSALSASVSAFSPATINHIQTTALSTEEGKTSEPVGDDTPRADIDSRSESPSRDAPPSSSKGKRPPIPDFRHPVSKNTVPASLFKALVNMEGESATRPTVRSRLSSREVFEHNSRPSLDDLTMPSISRKGANNKKAALENGPIDLFTPVPGSLHMTENLSLLNISGQLRERALSLPLPPSVNDGSVSPAALSDSILSSVHRNHGRDGDLEHYEERLEELLDDKMNQIRHDLAKLTSAKIEESMVSTQKAISQLLSTLKTEHSRRATEDDSRADAQGELDFDLIRTTIEQGQLDLRASLQRDLSEMAQRLELQASVRPEDPSSDVVGLVEDLSARTLSAINGATAELVSHLESVDDFARRRPAEERRALLQELMNALVPHINTLRQDPLDTDYLTMQLSEAVKPHISQLIDLASDKQETAALILKHLTPVLTSFIPQRLDFNAIGSQLASDLNRIAPPPDPHVLKEEVADLVVERLASRLAVRDSAFSPDAIASRLSESLKPLFSMGDNVPSAEAIDSLLVRHEMLQDEHRTLVERHADITARFSVLPDSITSATDALRAAQSELVTKTGALKDFEELQRVLTINSELQTQLSKARASHGQARSEKDVLGERLGSAEAERERLRTEVEALRNARAARDAELAAANAKTTQLEDALAQALERLKASDVILQTHQERVTSLEQSNRDLSQEAHDAKLKVNTLELEAVFAARDLEASSQARKQLESERDALMSQQRHWDDLRRTADHVEALSKLIGDADTEEIKELKRAKDKGKMLEGEFSSLQKRYNEQEAKLANLQRASITSKHSIAQAQQRSSEWEKRTHELEADLESTRTKLDHSDDMRTQLDAEISSLRMQLEETEGEAASAKEREQRLAIEVSSLGGQLSSLKEQLEQTTKAQMYAPRPSASSRPSWVTNGRSVSRLSSNSRSDTNTPGPERDVTPNGRYPVHRAVSAAQSRPISPEGVSASIHNPLNKGRNSYATPQRYRPASPALSSVSLAPTVTEDGWWS